MSKCLYTEADVTQSGAQLIIEAVTLDGDVITDKDKHFKRAFPEAWNVMNEMLITGETLPDEDKVRVSVGDVVWARTGGNKHIGFCVVKEDQKSIINKKAVRLCIKSAKSKAKELGLKYVGMDLFASETPEDWANIVTIVEEELADIQGIVCIPTNDELVAVLEGLPGSKDFTVITQEKE